MKVGGLGFLCQVRKKTHIRERGWDADLERGDVGMGHVAVHILDLRQVLLGHVHELRSTHLVGDPRESLVERWRVIFLVVVLLQHVKTDRDGERAERADMKRGRRGRRNKVTSITECHMHLKIIT